ncbi:MAG: nuclear transport factor 2 family protein [Spirochaetales bacterium]|nr:nuclear transport factor 2 family protein [Leptospiraceae bacterium]MCP5480792.1 nuclear transport factor 2 family protein [Spirochaetales bacterium]
MDIETATRFCNRWLPAWTGNRPDRLIEFYAQNASYQDPGLSRPLTGRKTIERYFRRLLRANPRWVWEAEEIFPTPGGFTLKWRARIPIGDTEHVLFGLDIVELEEVITRNEVFFDRSVLLAEAQSP